MNEARHQIIRLAKRLAGVCLLLVVLSLGQTAWAGWVAYNDFGAPSHRDKSISRIGATLAELKASTGTVLKTGNLIDFATGQASGVQLKLSINGSPLGQAEIAPGAPEPRRRLALAKHLTQPGHPLTARVLVNRVWQNHFGNGLVDTPSDFGKMGTAPTHPELLDWLALEFIRQGWSLKKLHRLIVTSRIYRQASHPREQALRVDADARLLWRFPPRRLEAEAIRDGMLSVSGKLNLKMGGRGFDFFNQRGGLSDYVPKQTFDANGWRRMIYAHKVRMQAVDIFGIRQEYQQIKARYSSTNDLDKCYATLGANHGETLRDIKKKYRRLAMEFHPDRVQSNGVTPELALLAEERFKEIQHAFDVVEKHLA